MAAATPDRATKDFREHIEEIAETHYDGDLAKAFRHAAFQLIAPDPNLTDSQIIELTAIDKSGDLEIDGCYEDESGETIILFQSYGGEGKVNEAKVAKFWSAPDALLNPDRVEMSGNQSVRDLAVQLEEGIRKGFAVRMVFASRGGFDRSASAFAQTKSQVERTLNVQNYGDTVASVTLALCAEPDLASDYGMYRMGFISGVTPRVTINMDTAQYHLVEREGIKSIRATIPASAIVDEFLKPGVGYRLFSLNPRGPLANAKVNKNIAKTMTDQGGADRKLFHLLNNGICATCESFDIKDGKLSIDNLQIVNGCQTTVTLSKFKAAQLRDTFVDMKLAVAPKELAERIAIASNSQTALRTRDYASFDGRQRELQHAFERECSQPYYYEIKQGYWRFVLTDRDKAKFKAGKRKRHIEVQSLAQASLAFLGQPEEALDRVRYVFEGIRDPLERTKYEQAFPADIKAQQFLLAWKMLDWLERTDNPVKRPRFSTFHLLWLAAEYIRKQYEIDVVSYPSRQACEKLAQTTDDWLPSLVRVGERACSQALRRAKHIRKEDIDVREFFRSTAEISTGVSAKGLLKEAFDAELEMQSDDGRSFSVRMPRPGGLVN